MKERTNVHRQASKKCKGCGSFLGKSRFRFSVSNDAVFCGKDCAAKNKVKNDMADNDESEFYI